MSAYLILHDLPKKVIEALASIADKENYSSPIYYDSQNNVITLRNKDIQVALFAETEGELQMKKLEGKGL